MDMKIGSKISCDVLVAGGGVAGFAAAIAATSGCRAKDVITVNLRRLSS